MALEVREGHIKGGLPCLSFGEGPPLVVFPGLGITNANPKGLQRWGELRLLAPLARVFTVHRISRRVGLASGTTIEVLADVYALALDEEFGEPVDVLGISTGGSLALQLAADRPELVRRLVVAAAACRLSEHGRRFQQRVAELSAAGDWRGLSMMQAPDVADSRIGRWIAGEIFWLRAEDAFDIGDRLGEISAPTLVIGGGRDRFYPTELFRETADGIPNGRLILYEDRAHGGTLADWHFGKDVIAFLSADQTHT